MRSHQFNTAVRFFMEHAGGTYTPAKETAAQGRYRTALALASAERKARERGFRFSWTHDVDTWDDEAGYPQWVVSCHDADGITLASVGGVDVGADGAYEYGCGMLSEPTYKGGRDPYCRVIEAELALESLSNPRR